MLKTRYWIALTLLSVGALGGLLPETPTIPVQGATTRDWHPQSFWYYPWGRSGTHKGIDIFAQEGTPVLAATHGLVVHTGVDSLGGNIVLVLGSKPTITRGENKITLSVPSSRQLSPAQLAQLRLPQVATVVQSLEQDKLTISFTLKPNTKVSEFNVAKGIGLDFAAAPVSCRHRAPVRPWPGRPVRARSAPLFCPPACTAS